MGLGSVKKTFTQLDRLLTVLDATNNNVFLWPFLESSGILVQSYGDEDQLMVPSVAGGATALDDAAAGFEPYRHAGGVHSYHFEAGNDNVLIGADAANLSFNGTTDTAFSVGCWFYIDSGTGELITKYNAGDTDREYRFGFAAGPDLRLSMYDETADNEEGAQLTTALSTRRWYFGVATYGGAGGDSGGAVGDDCLLYIDGAVVGDVDIDDNGYVDMDDGATELIIGGSGDTAAPADEFTGRIALPFLVNAELTALQIETAYGIGRRLLGL